MWRAVGILNASKGMMLLQKETNEIRLEIEKVRNEGKDMEIRLIKEIGLVRTEIEKTKVEIFKHINRQTSNTFRRTILEVIDRLELRWLAQTSHTTSEWLSK